MHVVRSLRDRTAATEMLAPMKCDPKRAPSHGVTRLHARDDLLRCDRVRCEGGDRFGRKSAGFDFFLRGPRLPGGEEIVPDRGDAVAVINHDRLNIGTREGSERIEGDRKSTRLNSSHT